MKLSASDEHAFSAGERGRCRLRLLSIDVSRLDPLDPLQMLRVDKAGLVERFLLAGAARSVYFAHLLVCQLKSEGTPPDEAFKPTVRSIMAVLVCSTFCHDIHPRIWMLVQCSLAAAGDTGLWPGITIILARIRNNVSAGQAQRLGATR